MCLTAGLIVGKKLCRMLVSSGSRGQVVGLEFRRSLETSSSLRGANVQTTPGTQLASQSLNY